MKKLPLLKQVQVCVGFLAIVALAPLVLAKFGFWNATHAASTFTKPNPPISYPSAVSFSEAIGRAAPSVVSIHSTKAISKDTHPLMRDPFFRYFFGGELRGELRGELPPEMQTGIGSGVIVTQDGYVLTNNHVINEADEIVVKLSDGRTSKAKVVGADPETDLAVLKIGLKDLPAIGISQTEPRIGDLVFAIGNPYGVGQTVTQGIVSALQRQNLGISTYENFIQTDAAINPGNSGGALIDVNGNLIGINNAIYSRTGGFQGIGFAIPVSSVKEVMAELINQGHIVRGWLGISVGPLTPVERKSSNYPTGEGAVIVAVIRGGPAFNAGLRPGDIIVSLNNQSITDQHALMLSTSKLKPETTYPISVARNGQTLDFRIVAGKRPLKKPPLDTPPPTE